nr:MAG TPA: hyaluronidase [Caudoviricetes sp.]
MANKTLNIRIQLRNDTAENWTTANPVLLKGEMGVEIDTGKTKIGNGTDDWKTLKYSGVDEDTIKGIIDNNRSAFTEVAPNEGESDAQALARVITTPKKGDMAVVVREFVSDKHSYTAYIYDTAWSAMDGNYSADNVYFDKDLTYTANIGVLTVPSSGSGTISASGKNVKDVLASILASEKNPSTVAPAVIIGTQTNFGTFEIGTKKNLVYGATLSAGSYTYGPATGITAKTWEATCTGVTGSKTTASGTFENVVAEATAKTITVKATYDAGAIPVTNLGNQYPAGQIKAGSASKTSSSLVGVRYMFWGPMTDASAELNSANIRALAHNKATGTGALSTFGAGAGAKKVVVAVPAGRKITKVLMPSALNADVTALFVKQSAQVQVQGANAYTTAAYDVYVYQPASIDAGETYTVTIG